MPYDHNARMAAVDAAIAESFDGMLDYIYISNDSGSKRSKTESITVQTDQPPYIHHFVKKTWAGDKIVRIDVFGVEQQRPLLRSLGEVEEDVSQKELSRGVFRHVYAGLVLAGPGIGGRQKWQLAYYP